MRRGGSGLTELKPGEFIGTYYFFRVIKKQVLRKKFEAKCIVLWIRMLPQAQSIKYKSQCQAWIPVCEVSVDQEGPRGLPKKWLLPQILAVHQSEKANAIAKDTTHLVAGHTEIKSELIRKLPPTNQLSECWEKLCKSLRGEKPANGLTQDLQSKCAHCVTVV